MVGEIVRPDGDVCDHVLAILFPVRPPVVVVVCGRVAVCRLSELGELGEVAGVPLHHLDLLRRKLGSKCHSEIQNLFPSPILKRWPHMLN